jgi:hydrocephalus-inducing protein
MSSKRSSSKKSKKKMKGSIQRRVYPKYDRNYAGPETVYATMSPSTLAMSVRKPLQVSRKTAPVPEMIEFLDIRSSAQPNSYVSIDEPIFQPLVSSLMFDDYEPFRTYTKKLWFRNNDNVARRLKILPSDSPYFSVSVPKTAQKGTRKDGTVAAGMELCFNITFKPQQKRPYNYRLICVTEREKFVVPVMATGLVACLNFQDQYDFGDVPCKSKSKQTFTVHNTGTAPAQFSLSTSAPFTIHCKDSFLPVNGSTQVDLEFHPQTSRDYSGNLVISYRDDNDTDEKIESGAVESFGRTVHVDLTGSGIDVEVGMVSSSIIMEPTYISLSSYKKVKIFNRSGIPVKYSWKAFASVEEEQMERKRLLTELDRMESIEREDILEAEFAEDDSDLSSDDDADVDTGAYGAARAAALSALKRKYKNLRKAVHDDLFLFNADENFKVDPFQGELWPDSELDVIVTFLPSIASEYVSEIFLDITGQTQRAVLNLRGVGIGPKAMFSYDMLDIGDVFLGSKHSYKLSLQNQGDIPAHYQLQPIDQAQHERPSFKFSPPAGTLAVGDTHVLDIDFTSDILGEFSEKFTFNLRGSSESLSVHFKGHVVGPTFHFDAEELDFGRVSFEFLHSKNLCLYNTSEIPMEFRLRVPQDGKMTDKEFEVIPSSGSVLPGGKQNIRVDFISTTAKMYEYFLTVDVKGVGEGLCSIPILAECAVPDVKLVTTILDYESCFLRHPYTQEIVLKNHSVDLRSRFEVLPQDKHTKALAEFTTSTQRGIIEPASEIIIDLSLTCYRLGSVKLPVYVRISGSERPPLLPMVQAVAVGPVITADLDVIDWKKISCLCHVTKTITLTNESLIPAPYQAVIKNLRSKFTVGPPLQQDSKRSASLLDDDDDVAPALGIIADNDDNIDAQEEQRVPGEGLLAPGASEKIVITCNLDDTTRHKDTLTIIVAEGEPLTVGLVARGTGTTMHCDEDIGMIDFGFQFTNGICSRKFLLENKGRRSQQLNWVNTTIKKAIAARRHAEHKAKLEAAAAEKAGIKRKKKKRPSKDIKAIFSVSPDSIELKPRTACYFEFTGAIASPAECEEVLVCEARVGNEQKSQPVFNTLVKAIFIDPLLEPSTRAMSFEYQYEPEVPLAFKKQPLTLKNISELPLEFTLQTAVPFNVDAYEFSLEPGESASLNVEFDPGWNDDRTTCHANGSLTIIYATHPQRDTIQLSGHVNFPNLEFSFREVDFGCVLNDTATSSIVKITNISAIDVDFQWTFLESEDKQLGASTSKPYIPIHQAFDILPIRGVLKPGQSEDVEVMFYGHANRNFEGLVYCEVEGGPEYQLKLNGEASDVQYAVDVTELNYGNVLHDKFGELDFSILNLGKVPFDFRFNVDHLKGPHLITVYPMQGRIFDNDKQRVVVRFSPQVPQEVLDKIVVEVAHFEALNIPIMGKGIFSQASFSLPLVEPDTWPRLMSEAAQSLAAKAKAAEEAKAKAAMEAKVALDKQVVVNSNNVMSEKNTSGRNTSSVRSSHTSAATANQNVKTKKRKKRKSPRSPEEVLLLDTELEARRLFFMEHLMGIIEKEGSLERLHSQRPSTTASKHKGQKGKKSDTEFIVAEHLADFGNVIAGTNKKKVFRVTNFGDVPVTLLLDKRLPAAHGFTVEPEKVNRLPEGASVDFVVRFKARKSQYGQVSVDVPIDIKSGPPAQLVLRANVTVPDIAITPNSIDFGDVVVGQCRVVTVQLSNTSPVTSEWAIKHLALTGAMARAASRFSYEPNSGILRPGERQNVEVTFTPTSDVASTYTVPFRTTSNPIQRFLEVTGEGKLLAVTFDPPHIVLPTVRPYDPPIRQTVELINNGNYRVEVYSLDFDQRYLQEEQIISKATTFDERGVVLVPPRIPGADLAVSLLPSKEANRALRRAARQPFQRKDATDFVIVGPSVSGKTTQARRLAEKYNISVLSLAQLMTDAQQVEERRAAKKNSQERSKRKCRWCYEQC